MNTIDYKSFIGIRIKKRRNFMNLTQEKLGEKIGIKKQNINRWEQGRTVPTIENLTKIAKALDIDITYFFPSSVVNDITDEECQQHMYNASVLAKDAHHELRAMKMKLSNGDKISLSSIENVRIIIKEIELRFEASILEYTNNNL